MSTGGGSADLSGVPVADKTAADLFKDELLQVLGGAISALKETQQDVKSRQEKQDSLFDKLSKQIDQSSSVSQRQFEELQRELHVKGTGLRSDRIQDPELRQMAVPYDAAASSLHAAGAAFQDHATGLAPLSSDQPKVLASQCAEGEAACLLRVTFYQDWDKEGKEFAEEMMSMRQEKNRDPLELALKKKALKAAEKRRAEQVQLEELKAKAAKADAPPPKRQNTYPARSPSPNPYANFYPPAPQLPASAYYTPYPAPVTPVPVPVPQYPAAQKPPVYPPRQPTPPLAPLPVPLPVPSYPTPPRQFTGQCFACNNWGHKSTECPFQAAAAANAGRSIG